MFKGNSLSRRIFLMFSLLFFVVLVIISIMLYSFIRNNERNQDRTYLSSNAALIAQQAENIFDNADQISVRSFFSANIINALTNANHSEDQHNYFANHIIDSNLISTDLFTIVGMDITDMVINFYNSNGFYSSKYYPISWDRVQDSMKNGHIAEVEATLSEKPVIVSRVDTPYWTNVQSGSDGYIALTRKFQNYTTRKVSGTVEILIPIMTLDKLFMTENDELTMLLFTDEGSLLYGNENGKPTSDFIEECCSKQGSVEDGFYSSANQTDVGYIKSIDQYGLKVAVIKTFDTHILVRYVLIIAMLGLLLYAISVGTFFIIFRKMTQPLNQVVESLKNISWSQMEMSLDFTSGNIRDTDVLQEAYSAMYQKLTESINLLMSSRLNEQRSLFLALQSQISPHFICNTIANISACAYESGEYKIVDICDKLSGLLRYAADYSSELSDISRELEYTQNYLDLMKLRYEGNFMYTVACDNNCERIHVPRLILQTVVENCFKHAFNQTNLPWFISINCYCENDWWLIDVCHNGVPVSNEKLDEIIRQSGVIYNDIAHGLPTQQQNGLGLLNSITRLRMYCNNLFRFESLTDSSGNSIIRFGGKI